MTSEPYAVEKEGGFKPNLFLLADYGFDTYATTIETMQDTIDKRPEVVKCFVDGSAKGWYNYLYGDNAAANALIKKDNPDMTDEQIAFSIAKMKEYGIVDCGDARKARHRRHDRRAHAELLRQDGQGQASWKPASTSRSPTRSTSSTRASAWTSRSDAFGRNPGVNANLAPAKMHAGETQLILRSVGKTFANGTVALSDVDLTDPAGRFRVACSARRAAASRRRCG